MKFRKLLSGLKQRFLPSKEKIVIKELLGVKLKVIDGTIRKKVDYDDAWFYALARNSKIFFDVGANIGYTGILANLAKSIKRIVLVDPNPNALIYASKNLLLNNMASNCSFYTAFASDQVGENVKFFTAGVGAAGSMYPSHAQTASMSNNFFYVGTVTIDFLTNYYNVIPDLVKVDIEGAEYSALRGATELASKLNTRFLVEMHRLEKLPMEQNGNNILQWAKEIGYKVWYLANHSELMNGSEIAHRGKCHLLLQPAHWEFPQYLKVLNEGAPLPEK